MSHGADRELRPHPVIGGAFPSPVPPGAGWPEDPASDTTPIAAGAAQVRHLAATTDLAELDARVSLCRACPRLVRWREDVAATKRASFAEQPYWGRPIPGWGEAAPVLLIVGLAPAAHGGNRTGRIFTGDSSGDWLFASLYRTGWARTGSSEHAGDGQRLIGARMVATVRCAPPANKPTVTERDTCAPWIAQEIRLLRPSLRVVVALGAFGWAGALRALTAAGLDQPRPKPRFGHGAEVVLTASSPPGAAEPAEPVTLLGCYHPSQHNTFTGRLTPTMLDAVFERARAVGFPGYPGKPALLG